MKKIIAISVMFALVVAGAFAADVSGEVIGTFIVASQDGDGDTMAANGGLNRVRAEFSGANDDETFGAWARLEWDWWGTFTGTVWWKPIPQFKLSLGGNPDGHWGLEGYSGWMFYQRATDPDVAMGGENVWGGGFGTGTNFRSAFYAGFWGGLMMDIAPMDMLGINIGIPFGEDKLADAYQKAVLQVNLNLDFGNIGLTFDMAGSNGDGKLFVYFGLGAVENLSLDIGFGYGLSDKAPMAIGLALKYGFSDSFALKFRAMAELPDSGDPAILVDVMPVIGINDNMTACISVGVANQGDVTEFHFNPFLWVGQEWGPSFWAGIKVWTTENMDTIHWAIPIAIGVGF
jgi:hypothetical protein